MLSKIEKERGLLPRTKNVAPEFNTPKNLFGDTDNGRQLYLTYKHLSQFVHPSIRPDVRQVHGEIALRTPPQDADTSGARPRGSRLLSRVRNCHVRAPVLRLVGRRRGRGRAGRSCSCCQRCPYAGLNTVTASITPPGEAPREAQAAASNHRDEGEGGRGSTEPVDALLGSAGSPRATDRNGKTMRHEPAPVRHCPLAGCR